MRPRLGWLVPGKRGPPPSLKYSAFATFCICDMLCSLLILLELTRDALSSSRMIRFREGPEAWRRVAGTVRRLAAHRCRGSEASVRHVGAATEVGIAVGREVCDFSTVVNKTGPFPSGEE